jgi:transposase
MDGSACRGTESTGVINPLLPDAWVLRCRQILIEPERVTIEVETMAPGAACPLCGRSSGRVHSRYWRSLYDLPWQGRVVHWRLKARKFFCDNIDCRRGIFTEPIPKVASAHARGTVRLNLALSDLAFACGGEAGARLAVRLAMPTSPDTLLRRIRCTKGPMPSTAHVVGVDDWAVRKGQRYGTILCDLEEHRPVDMLNNREAQTVAAWLQGHPEIRVITRDRARFYAEGAATGAPQAMQVADRFHLMQNLRHALVRMLERRHPHLVAAAHEVGTGCPPPLSTPRDFEPPKPTHERRLPRHETIREIRRARRLERYQKVIELHKKNVSDRAIAKHLGINRETVARYVQAGQLPERAPRKYACRTDPYTEYLRRRWDEGCHNAAQLFRELTSQEFVVSYCSVRRRVAHWDHCCSSMSPGGSPPQPPAVAPPSAKRLAWLLLKERGDWEERDGALFEALFRRCPELVAGASLARDFALMLRKRQGIALDDWIQRAWNRGIPRELRVFATGLKSDYDAVKAALTTDWSNGQVEGQVNRLKLIKRQMYGRAKFDLLRQRVLHTG